MLALKSASVEQAEESMGTSSVRSFCFGIVPTLIGRLASTLGWHTPCMIGLTLGHSILIVRGYMGNRLVSHECRHVYQYEIHGSIAAFLPVYLL
jgi:hypothetical protein